MKVLDISFRAASNNARNILGWETGIVREDRVVHIVRRQIVGKMDSIIATPWVTIRTHKV